MAHRFVPPALALLLLAALLLSLAVGGECSAGGRRLRHETRGAPAGRKRNNNGGGNGGKSNSNNTAPPPFDYDGDGEQTPPSDYDDGTPPLIDVGGCMGGPPTCSDCKYNRFDCVIDYSKGCQSVNYDCADACSLWRGIAECRLRTPVPSYCSDTYFYAPSDPTVKNWLIEPTAPNYIGLEDLPSSSANPAVDTLWHQAWGDATAGVDGRKKIAAADLALVINSVQARTKHSLHIHVGTATAALKTCVDALPKAAVEDTWMKGPAPCPNLSSTATEPTTVYYTLVTAAKRNRVNAFLLDGLKFLNLYVEKNVDVGFALVGAPKSAGAGPDDNYLLIYNGKGVNDKKLLVQ